MDLPLYAVSPNHVQNCTVATQSASWGFSTAVSLYGFRRNCCVAAYTDDFDTPVSWDNRPVVQVLQILLQYCPVFLLKELVFAHACYLKKTLF